jgi:hypothetical protein
MRHDWVNIRAKYEAGATQSELARKFKVSRTAIQLHIKAEGWQQDISKSLNQRVEAKLAGLLAGGNPHQTAVALDVEAQKRVDIITGHRKEWTEVAGLRYMALGYIKEKSVPESFECMRLVKITSEVTAIKQAGERKAWGIDMPYQPPQINVSASAMASANGDSITAALNYDDFARAFSEAFPVAYSNGVANAIGDGFQQQMDR